MAERARLQGEVEKVRAEMEALREKCRKTDAENVQLIERIGNMEHQQVCVLACVLGCVCVCVLVCMFYLFTVYLRGTRLIHRLDYRERVFTSQHNGDNVT